MMKERSKLILIILAFLASYYTHWHHAREAYGKAFFREFNRFFERAYEVEHVRDIMEIGQYGVIGTPALIINATVMAVGTVPSKARIKEWLSETGLS